MLKTHTVSMNDINKLPMGQQTGISEIGLQEMASSYSSCCDKQPQYAYSRLPNCTNLIHNYTQLQQQQTKDRNQNTHHMINVIRCREAYFEHVYVFH